VADAGKPNWTRKFLAVTFVVLLGLAAAIAYVYYLPLPVLKPAGEKTLSHKIGGKPKTKVRPAKIDKRPTGTIIIDDIGYDMTALKRLLAMGVDFAFSVLPEAPRAADSARLIRASGRELMVHIPCEPIDRKQMKGMRFLQVDQDAAEIRTLAGDLLDLVPGAAGANNHMGSRFTANEKATRALLGVIKSRGLFFVDSVTSWNTVAYQMASGMGIKCLKRDIFLDHDPSARAVQAQLDAFQVLTKEKDGVVAIGHPHENTVAVLGKWVKNGAGGLKIIRPSKMIEHKMHKPTGQQKKQQVRQQGALLYENGKKRAKAGK